MSWLKKRNQKNLAIAFKVEKTATENFKMAENRDTTLLAFFVIKLAPNANTITRGEIRLSNFRGSGSKAKLTVRVAIRVADFTRAAANTRENAMTARRRLAAIQTSRLRVRIAAQARENFKVSGREAQEKTFAAVFANRSFAKHRTNCTNFLI